MRDFTIDLIWAKIQAAITVIGGWMGYFLGGLDGLMIALVIFVVLDYVTGIMCAIADKKLSSSVGFKGICRKVLIFLLVGVAHIVDLHVVGSGSVLRGRPYGSRLLSAKRGESKNSVMLISSPWHISWMMRSLTESYEQLITLPMVDFGTPLFMNS